ncbi:MAG: response regulator transcription factor [Anaerolineae bacterium]|nr:response regulator transcription factor [Anaerolineae bacterium]
MITIMLVDDHTVVRDGLRLLLEMQPDFRIIAEANNGREAVARASETCPDVIVMDIAMPELNGIDALRQIRHICPATRVIVLSMHTASNYVIQALQAGADGYLLKATAGTEVIHAIRVVQSGQRYLSQMIVDTVISVYLGQPETKTHKPPLDRLSPREREILQLVVEGKSSAQIAEVLFISSNTVDTYRSRLMQKLGISDLPTLVKFAIQQGLTTLD